MTEKRFKEIISTQKVIDTVTNKEYDCLLDNDFYDLVNSLAEENEQLREALKNSYVTELCENCKHVIYESWEVPFCGWEHDRECKKGHNECEVTECDDFELNLKVWLND